VSGAGSVGFGHAVANLAGGSRGLRGVFAAGSRGCAKTIAGCFNAVKWHPGALAGKTVWPRGLVNPGTVPASGYRNRDFGRR
jgi:hypothetical protein